MSKRGWFIIAIYIFILLGVFTLLFGKKLFPEKKIHYHAGFVVFQNNKKIDFSDNKYMNIRPCTKDDDAVKEDPQLEKAHLHDNVGDVVHVEHVDALWKDLFTNLHYPIDYTKTTAYINGEKVSNFQSQTIHPYDSIVIFIDKNDAKYIKEAVKKEHIIQIENKSESCGDN